MRCRKKLDDEDEKACVAELKGEDHVPNESEHSASGPLPRMIISALESRFFGHENNFRLPQNKSEKGK